MSPLRSLMTEGLKGKDDERGIPLSYPEFSGETGLIDFVEGTEMIKTTKKLDSFMDWNLLNQNHQFQRVLKELGVEHE